MADAAGTLERTDRWATLVGDLLPALSSAVPGWGVLKNADALPLVTGDLDLCVPRARWQELCDALVAFLRERGRFSVVVCDHWPGKRFVLVASDGPAERALEIDLIDETWSRGAPAARAAALLPFLVEDGRGFRALRPGAEAAVLLGRYALGPMARLELEAVEHRAILARAAGDPDGFAAALETAWGRAGRRAARAFLAGSWPRATRRRLGLVRAKRALVASPRRSAAWVRRRGVLHWRPMPRAMPDGPAAWRARVARGHACVRTGAPRVDGRGRWIVLCGPDGTGKSTLARHVADVVADGRVLHWRPGLLPRLGAIAGLAAADPTRPHARQPYGRAVSIARLAYYWLDHVLGAWLVVRPAVRRGAVVVVERGYWDMAVDRARYRLGVSARLVRALGALVPRPDRSVVLVGDAGILAARKREIGEQETARQVAEWRRVARRRGWIEIDATRPIDEVVRSLEDAVNPNVALGGKEGRRA